VEPERILELLEESGAIQHGHFVLSSGKHSDRYVEKFNLLRNPGLTSRLCEGFTDRFRDLDGDVIAGPTTGGILLAFEVARQLGLAAAYAERVSEGSLAREFRRGTSFASGSRVAVVDDILTTGGSIRETIVALEALDVEIVAIGVLVDRSGGAVSFGRYPLLPLLSMDVEAWPAESCPLCQSGIPITRPGTTSAA
jgi:orotate phosphoribosyltransferase